MSTGLIALLDDVIGIAKVAAASVDDVTAQAARAGLKSAGVVIDDAAVTPRYVVGFAADRELPIIARIAQGSLINKIVFLLPAALALAFFAPWAVTPLLMLGGGFLCYEGAEKVLESIAPHAAHAHEAEVLAAPLTPGELEAQKISGAIKTDFILSAEIMAITLAGISSSSFWMQAAVLAIVGIGITVVVYGGVALIVKADDFGLYLAKREGTSIFAGLARGFGRSLVKSMPVLLKILSVIGTAAMIWVGGGIILHGLEEYGLGSLAHLIHDAAAALGSTAPRGGELVAWIVNAAGSGVVGLVIGAALIPLAEKILVPGWKRLRRVAGAARLA
jgi:predicted DNA repair protein MutK